MPGLVGIIRKNSYGGVSNDLQQMVEAMRHTKHDAGGTYVNEGLGLYAGWMCHQKSFSDCMPLISHEKDVVLIFHGEHFLGNGALDHGGANTKGPDARYLLDLYKQHGEDFFAKLNGWFCGIVADLRNKKVVLFNDRYGMGRLYFHEGQDEFVFASEAKCLLKIRPTLRQLEPDALAEHLRFNCVTGNKSLFKDVSLLPKGSCWDFANGTLDQRKTYFSFTEWERQSELPPGDFYRKLTNTVSRVFPVYAGGEEKVALSLTAGLDTRAILAALKGRNRPLPCYTFGGTWGELFDIRTARKLAKISNQSFDTIKINDQFLKTFSDYARRAVYISDGLHDALGAHDVYFNEVARDLAPVR